MVGIGYPAINPEAPNPCARLWRASGRGRVRQIWISRSGAAFEQLAHFHNLRRLGTLHQLGGLGVASKPAFGEVEEPAARLVVSDPGNPEAGSSIRRNR